MKKFVLGISISGLLLAGPAMQLSAQGEEQNPPGNPPAVSAPEAAPPPMVNSETAPASIEKLKEKIDAINARSAGGMQDVVKLYQAGVDKGVIETYIRNSRLPAPSPQDLIYLHSQGIPEDIVKVLIDHGGAAGAASSSSSAPATVPAPQPQTDSTAQPGATYNNYVYNSPSPTIIPSTGSYASAAPNNNVLVIPYNPYRYRTEAFYAPPLGYSYYDPWYYSPWCYSGYGPSYSFGFSFGYPYRYHYSPYRFGYGGPYRFGLPHHGGLRSFGGGINVGFNHFRR